MAAHRKGPAEHRYTIVQVRVWTDEKTSQWGMPPPHPLTLFTWLLTCPFTLRVPGVVAAGRAAMAEALAWSMEDFNDCFALLEGAGLALADWKARLVYLPGAFRQQENRPSSPPSAATWKRELANAPECDLLRQIVADVRALLATMNPAFGACFEAGGRADWELPTPLARELPSGYLSPAPAPKDRGCPSKIDAGEITKLSDKDKGSGDARAPTRALPPKRGTQMAIPMAAAQPEVEGKPASDKQGQVVRRHLAQAQALLQELNQARAGVLPQARGFSPTYQNLHAIAERLEAGATAEEVRHVIAVCADKVRRGDAPQWFNPETPFTKSWPRNLAAQVASEDPEVDVIAAARAPYEASDPEARRTAAEACFAQIPSIKQRSSK